MDCLDWGSIGHTNAGFGEYRCLYMAAPILTATVEYYIKQRNSVAKNQQIMK